MHIQNIAYLNIQWNYLYKTKVFCKVSELFWSSLGTSGNLLNDKTISRL